MINRYNPEIHKGNQPIRVLFDGIISFYCNWTDSFNNDLNNEIKFNGLNRKIMIDISESPIDNIAFVDKNKIIHLEETFISFIWIVCYAQLVIAEKMIPRTEDIVINPDDINLGKAAFSLFNYGMSLTKTFSNWPDNLPNPEKYNEIDAHYIERANRACIIVTTFILFHEFAHVYLGHIDYDILKHPISTNEYKENELSADKFAIETIICAIKPEDFLDAQACVLIGLSALLLLSGSLDGMTHPDPDLRIEKAISLLNLEDNSNLFNIPCIGYYLWCLYYRKKLEMPEQCSNTRERFQRISEQLHQNQFTTISSELFRPNEGYPITRNNVSIIEQAKMLTKPGVFLSDTESIDFFHIMQTFLDAVQERKIEYDKEKIKISEFKELIDSNEIFYKYVSKDTLENYIKKGIFKLGTLNYYQKQENNKLKNEKERKTHLIIEFKDKQLCLSLCSGFNYLLFCGSNIPPTDIRSQYLRDNFGSCVLKITNIHSFRREMQKHINASSSLFNKVDYKDINIIRYINNEDFNDISTELIDNKTFLLVTKLISPYTVFIKPYYYSEESEFRVAFELNCDQKHPVIVQNKGLLDYIEIIEA